MSIFLSEGNKSVNTKLLDIRIVRTVTKVYDAVSG